MRLTNKHNLPMPMYNAIATDPYSQPGHISVTSLIKPPRIRQLELRHAEQIVEDCADHIYRLLGQATHYITHRTSSDNVLAEERLSCEMAGWVVTGQADLLDADRTLSDYKVTSVWSVIFGLKPEWEAQLNCYAHLYREAGFMVNKLQVVAILRDWQKSKAGQDGYPLCACAVMPVPMWSESGCYGYLEDRVIMHQAAGGMADDELLLCTPQERWEKPTTYAVMKKGRKSALRVLLSMEEARAWMEENGKGDLVDIRHGESVRCEGYCTVKDFCNQYKEK